MFCTVYFTQQLGCCACFALISVFLMLHENSTRALYCRAGGRGFDYRDRTNT